MGRAAATGAKCWNYSTGPLQNLQPLVKDLFVWKLRKVALTQVATGKAGLIPVGGLPLCPDSLRVAVAGLNYGRPVDFPPGLQFCDLDQRNWDLQKSQNSPGGGDSPLWQHHLQAE